MDWISNPDIWISFLTLCALEIVLGIDNLIFISILTNKLPKNQQAKARQLLIEHYLATKCQPSTWWQLNQKTHDLSNVYCSRRIDETAARAEIFDATFMGTHNAVPLGREINPHAPFCSSFAAHLRKLALCRYQTRETSLAFNSKSKVRGNVVIWRG